VALFQGKPVDPRDWDWGNNRYKVKDSHTRIKSLALASSHGRCTTAIPKRILFWCGQSQRFYVLFWILVWESLTGII
jgi:hypothetical protein